MLEHAVPDEHWRTARRERMLDAAAVVFAERGFEAASMEDIAHAAGMTKPTFYRYFSGKEALFEAVFVNALDLLVAAIDRASACNSGAAARLEAMIRAIIPTFREHLVSLRSMSGASAHVEQGRRQIFRERREAIEARLADVIGDGIDEGIFGDVDARLIAQLIIGMAWSGATPERSDAELAEAMTQVLFCGLGGMRRTEDAARGAA
jgi:TetR/AcrR family transcriptional regulator, cholesterol catabolism regulator